MALQTHVHSQNLGLPISSPNYFLMDNNNNNNNLFFNEFTCNNFQQQMGNHHQQQPPHIVHQNLMFSKKQKLGINPTSSTTTSEIDDHNPMSFSGQIEKQRQEIDRFINLQNERLKLTLQEQRKQQMRTIIKKLEAKAMQLLKQKDYEITQANKRTMELLETKRKMEFENQSWQKIALENESMVSSLNNKLDQLKEQQEEQCSSKSSYSVDDVESSCNIFDAKNKNNNNVGRNDEETRTRKGGEEVCKVCKSRNVCVLMLPCRHLCCCNVCDAFLDACPLCNSSKMASIEAFFS